MKFYETDKSIIQWGSVFSWTLKYKTLVVQEICYINYLRYNTEVASQWNPINEEYFWVVIFFQHLFFQLWTGEKLAVVSYQARLPNSDVLSFPVYFLAFRQFSPVISDFFMHSLNPSQLYLHPILRRPFHITPFRSMTLNEISLCCRKVSSLQ